MALCFVPVLRACSTMYATVSWVSLKLSATTATDFASLFPAGRLKARSGCFASFAARIMGMQVLASFGTRMMPSTLRVMKFFTCCELAIRVLVRDGLEHFDAALVQIRLLMASKPATQYSVCNVSKATPTVRSFSPEPVLSERFEDLSPQPK